jgi:hypothetical protein
MSGVLSSQPTHALPPSSCIIPPAQHVPDQALEYRLFCTHRSGIGIGIGIGSDPGPTLRLFLLHPTHTPPQSAQVPTATNNHPHAGTVTPSFLSVWSLLCTRDGVGVWVGVWVMGLGVLGG